MYLYETSNTFSNISTQRPQNDKKKKKTVENTNKQLGSNLHVFGESTNFPYILLFTYTEVDTYVLSNTTYIDTVVRTKTLETCLRPIIK